MNTKDLGHICVHQRYTKEMPFHIIEENLDDFCAFLGVLNMKFFYHGKATRFFHALEHALGDEKWKMSIHVAHKDGIIIHG